MTTTTSHRPDLTAITDQIVDGLRRGKFTLRELQEKFVDKTKQAAESTNQLVHEYPWPAIGVGVGVGLAAGMLIGRVTSHAAARTQEAARHSTSQGSEAPSHALQGTLLFVLSVVKAVQAFRSIRF